MENTNLSRYTVSFGISLALASVADGVLVVAKEKSSPVMSGMQRLTGHHWITHSAVILLLFVICGLVLAQLDGGKGIKITGGRLICAVLSGVAAGGLIIFGFYLIGD
jgi:hypothetical protein